MEIIPIKGQGGVSAASANSAESKMETSDTASPDLPLFSTSKKKRIFVYSFSELSTVLFINFKNVGFIKSNK